MIRRARSWTRAAASSMAIHEGEAVGCGGPAQDGRRRVRGRQDDRVGDLAGLGHGAPPDGAVAFRPGRKTARRGSIWRPTPAWRRRWRSIAPPGSRTWRRPRPNTPAPTSSWSEGTSAPLPRRSREGEGRERAGSCGPDPPDASPRALALSSGVVERSQPALSLPSPSFGGEEVSGWPGRRPAEPRSSGWPRRRRRGRARWRGRTSDACSRRRLRRSNRAPRPLPGAAEPAT